MAKGFLNGYKTYDTSKGFGNAEKWKKAFHQRMTGDQARAILGEKSQTPFEILGIAQDANKETIKKAFRKLIMLWHPDKNPGREKEAEERSKQIIAAYTLLTTA